MTKQLKVLEVPEKSGAFKVGITPGAIVHRYIGHDYGCSRDDTMAFGEEYAAYHLPGPDQPFFTLPVRCVEEEVVLTPLERARQALDNHTEFNGDDMEGCALYIDGPESLFELPHDQGQFNLSDFRALVHGYEELKLRMDGLEK